MENLHAVVNPMDGKSLADSLKKQAEELRKKQTAVAQKERELDQREREMERSSQSLAEREASVAEAERRAERLASEAQALKVAASTERDRLRDRADSLSLREAEAEEAALKIAEIRESLRGREQEVEARHAELQRREKTLAEEERKTGERLADIVRRHEESASAGTDETELIAQRAKELDAVFDSLGRLKSDLESVKGTLSGKAGELAEKERALLKREKELASHIEETVAKRESILAREKELIALQSELRSIVHGEHAEPQKEEESREEPRSEPVPEEKAEAQPAAEAEPETREAAPDDYMSKSKPELVEIAKSLGLSTAGKRGELAKRIMAHRESERTAAPAVNQTRPTEAGHQGEGATGNTGGGEKPGPTQHHDSTHAEEETPRLAEDIADASIAETVDSSKLAEMVSMSALEEAAKVKQPEAVPAEDMVKEVIREAQASIAKAYNEQIDITALKPILKEAKDLARTGNFRGAYDKAVECRDKAVQAIETRKR